MNFSPQLNCKCVLNIIDVIFLAIHLNGNSAGIISIIKQADADGKETINKNIDYLIEKSIECEKHEITAFLIDYKYRNNLHTEKDWEL